MRQPYLVSSSLFVGITLALGCGGKTEEQDDNSLGDGIESLSGFDTDDESDSSSNETGLKLDTVSDESEGTAESGDTTEEGCKKVDLLFVIDNSGSMADEQINLVNSFPSFIDEIQTQLEGTDGYHIGVITSDAYIFNQGCTQEGAMVTATGGANSSQSVCGPYAEGHRYMTEADDLDQKFACAGQVGTGGDGNERPMQTMMAALSPSMNGAGGCNEGFLRDDALLVIVIITDEEDDHEIDGCAQLPQPGSNGEPGGWFAGVVAAKAGQEKNIVVLSLVGPPGPDPVACPALDKCSGGIQGAEVANRIVSFTSMFTHGIVGRVCEASYAGFFAEAVGIIDSACDDFDPIG
ncbi:MAG TPA: vWA domain-containing protein [Enhygromyxa sp.]|nr:vWA domain-containing protein [Enhygromyxa sp.]